MISICIIVKNVQALLPDCFRPLISLGYEIIIVDTGSTDKTKQVANQYTDKVYDFVWQDDFSAARNYSISKASNEYVLIIDSDEVVDNIDKDKLERLIKDNPDGIGRLLIKDSFTRNGEKFIARSRLGRLF